MSVFFTIHTLHYLIIPELVIFYLQHTELILLRKAKEKALSKESFFQECSQIALLFSNMKKSLVFKTFQVNPVYPFVFMDCIHYNAREDGRTLSRAAYIVLRVTVEGYKKSFTYNNPRQILFIPIMISTC